LLPGIVFRPKWNRALPDWRDPILIGFVTGAILAVSPLTFPDNDPWRKLLLSRSLCQKKSYVLERHRLTIGTGLAQDSE
jgi:hypothetical protein